jgi:hypothetical protein
MYQFYKLLLTGSVSFSFCCVNHSVIIFSFLFLVCSSCCHLLIICLNYSDPEGHEENDRNLSEDFRSLRRDSNRGAPENKSKLPWLQPILGAVLYP